MKWFKKWFHVQSSKLTGTSKSVTLSKQLSKSASSRLVFRKASGWENNQVTYNPDTLRGIGCNELSFRQNGCGNQVVFGSGVVLRDLKIVFKAKNSKLIIGDDVQLAGAILIVGDGRTLTIGERTTARGISILCRGADITIGTDCMFSREIEVRSTDVHKIYDCTTGEHLNPAAPTIIGRGVWVAARAFISKGAKIPDGSIVGAASFVNRAFDEPNVIIAGTPAKIVKTNVRWER
jgi:acetyltransferase-like isoleucine patch superfamily enzyme